MNNIGNLEHEFSIQIVKEPIISKLSSIIWELNLNSLKMAKYDENGLLIMYAKVLNMYIRMG